MTWPTPILVWKSPRPTEESNLGRESALSGSEAMFRTHCLPFLFSAFSSNKLPVYSMVMVSPALGLSTPLPGVICCLVTPMMMRIAG